MHLGQREAERPLVERHARDIELTIPSQGNLHQPADHDSVVLEGQVQDVSSSGVHDVESVGRLCVRPTRLH